MLAGFIGSSLRLEYTVIGDNVNISSRICSMSSKNQVLISEYTYEKVADKVEAIPIGPRQFKGKQNMVMVYEIVSIKNLDESTSTQAVPSTPKSPEVETARPSAVHRASIALKPIAASSELLLNQ